MLLRFAVLCDHANATQDGKLNVMGVFDRLYAPNFPATHRELFLVTSIETEAEDEETSRDISVHLIDADGRMLTELKGQINFGRGKQVINQLHLFHDLTFQAAGSYQFNIFFEGKPIKTLDLELVHVITPVEGETA